MTAGELHLRFEDLAMDGRPMLEPLTASLGAVWRSELTNHPLRPWALAEGIIPISTRFVIDAGEGPFAVEAPISMKGEFEISRTVDAAGATNRFLLVIKTELEAPLGRTNLPPPDETGVRRAGSVLAEHVFTRPFAEPDQRRVTDLGEYGRAARIVEWADPRALLELPAGAKPLGELSAEAHEIFFGMSHTDSNQHVNSLVYSRLFAEAVVQRLGRGELLARHLDIRFRKPSFAGDRVVIMMQTYEREGRAGACGAFVEPGHEPARGRVFLRMELA